MYTEVRVCGEQLDESLADGAYLYELFSREDGESAARTKELTCCAEDADFDLASGCLLWHGELKITEVKVTCMQGKAPDFRLFISRLIKPVRTDL